MGLGLGLGLGVGVGVGVGLGFASAAAMATGSCGSLRSDVTPPTTPASRMASPCKATCARHKHVPCTRHAPHVCAMHASCSTWQARRGLPSQRVWAKMCTCSIRRAEMRVTQSVRCARPGQAQSGRSSSSELAIRSIASASSQSGPDRRSCGPSWLYPRRVDMRRKREWSLSRARRRPRHVASKVKTMAGVLPRSACRPCSLQSARAGVRGTCRPLSMQWCGLQVWPAV